MHRIVAVLASFVISTVAVAQLHELQPAETNWSGHLRPDSNLYVEGASGDVEVVASEGDAITVEAKRGTDGTVVPRIVVLENEKGVTVCADYVAKEGQPSKCGTAKTRSSWSSKGYTRADFQIAVPKGTRVSIYTSGDVHVVPLGATVIVNALNGSIRATADGHELKASSLRGNIDVDITPEMLDQNIKLSVLEGRIRMVLPENRLIHYELYTKGARLHSAYPLAGGPKDAERDETKDQANLREITKNNYIGNLGPSKLKGPWIHLEAYITVPENSSMEIAK